MKDFCLGAFSGALLVVLLIGGMVTISESQEMDSTAAPEAAPIADPWPSEPLPERSIKFYSGFGAPPDGLFEDERTNRTAESVYDEPAPAPPRALKGYTATWIPGHWRPIADGGLITETPPMPKSLNDRWPGESFEDWEKRIKPEPPKPDERRPDPVAVRLETDWLECCGCDYSSGMTDDGRCDWCQGYGVIKYRQVDGHWLPVLRGDMSGQEKPDGILRFQPAKKTLQPEPAA